MPCHRCGARQTDPIRGESPWRRGVSSGVQVLVCPHCQRIHDWTAELDACARCGSTSLVRTLGETHCRACGASGEVRARVPEGPARGAPEANGSTPAGAGSRSAAEAAALSQDVAAALDRLFSRNRP
jgi:hypothetical protein